MNIVLIRRIMNWRTLTLYFSAVVLLLFVTAGNYTLWELFGGMSAERSMGRIDLFKTMLWNLCILPPISSSTLFMMEEYGLLSAYTILRSKNIWHWYMARFITLALANYAYLAAVIVLMSIFGLNRNTSWHETIFIVLLFPVHTILISSICTTAALIFRTGRTAIICYLFIEGSMVAAGMAYPPASQYLLPFWGMLQNTGEHFGATLGGSLLVLAALLYFTFKRLHRNNPAARPRNI